MYNLKKNSSSILKICKNYNLNERVEKWKKAYAWYTDLYDKNTTLYSSLLLAALAWNDSKSIQTNLPPFFEIKMYLECSTRIFGYSMHIYTRSSCQCTLYIYMYIYYI